MCLALEADSLPWVCYGNGGSSFESSTSLSFTSLLRFQKTNISSAT